MRPWDVARYAGGALLGHRRRTALSLLGMTVGVAAVLVLTALGEGARSYVTNAFASLGGDLLGIVPGHTETSGAIPGVVAGVPHDLTLDDARALRRALPEALLVTPLALGLDTVSAGERSREAMVLGTTPGFLEVRSLDVRTGRFLPEGDWDAGAPVVVLGTVLARELFPGDNPLGRTVRVGAFRLRIVGVMQSKGVQLGTNVDETAFVPVATVMRMFDRSSLFRIAVKLRPGSDAEACARRVASILTARHGELDVTVLTEDAVLASLTGILGALTAALAGIASVSLAVAGIGIMNVMLVSVAERTGEVGLLKALGARPRQVLLVFVTEAALLSVAGGLAGVALGEVVVHTAVALWPSIPARPPPWALAASLLVALGTGVSFGVLPARRAMRLDPVEALSRR